MYMMAQPPLNSDALPVTDNNPQINTTSTTTDHK